MKNTKPREYVRNVLQRASRPMCAADIYAEIRSAGHSVSLSTVYRILEVFVGKGLAVKTTVMDSGTALFECKRETHTHYAVCLGCRKMIALDCCPIEHAIPEISGGSFHVLGHKIEIYGYCGDCGADGRAKGSAPAGDNPAPLCVE